MLGIFLLGLLSGERPRKATPTELRWYSAEFLFIPIWMTMFVYIGRTYLDRVDAIGIWLYIMAFLFVGFVLVAGWARFVSANVSWCIGGLVWVVTLFLAITGRLI